LTFGYPYAILWLERAGKTMTQTKTAPAIAPTTTGAKIRATEATRTPQSLETLRRAGEIPHAVPEVRS